MNEASKPTKENSGCYSLLLLSPLVLFLALAVVWWIYVIFAALVFGSDKESTFIMLLIPSYLCFIAVTYTINRLVLMKTESSKRRYISSGFIIDIAAFLLVLSIGFAYLLTSYKGMCWDSVLDGHTLYSSCTLKEYLDFYGSRGLNLLYPAITIHAIATIIIFTLGYRKLREKA